jgi:hypothetical protein
VPNRLICFHAENTQKPVKNDRFGNKKQAFQPGMGPKSKSGSNGNVGFDNMSSIHNHMKF